MEPESWTFTDIIAMVTGLGGLLLLIIVRTRRPTPTNTNGAINPAMVCPHCATTGSVRTTAVTRKKGVSGGKATAAVLTLGWSMLATGLSRKETLTQAHCDRCSNTWDF